MTSLRERLAARNAAQWPRELDYHELPPASGVLAERPAQPETKMFTCIDCSLVFEAPIAGATRKYCTACVRKRNNGYGRVEPTHRHRHRLTGRVYPMKGSL